MTKLPTSQDLGGLPSARTGRRIASFDESAIGRGVENLGRGIAQAGHGVALALDTEQREEDKSWFIKARAESREHWSTRMTEAKVEAPEGAPEFVPLIEKEYDERASKVLETAPSDSAKELWSRWSREDRTVKRADAHRFATSAAIAARDSRYRAAFDARKRAVFADPDSLKDAIAEAADDIKGMSEHLPPKVLTKYREAFKAELTKAAIAGLEDAKRYEDAHKLHGLGGDAKKSLSRILVDPSRTSHIKGLDDGFASRLADMVAAAPPELRGDIRILSGARTKEHQKRLWDAAVKKYGSPEAARKWVAPPGRSKHNVGAAVDLSYGSDAAKKWAHANAKKFGLHFRMKHEPWHIEPVKGKWKSPERTSPIPFDEARRIRASIDLAEDKAFRAGKERMAIVYRDAVTMAETTGEQNLISSDDREGYLRAFGPDKGGAMLDGLDDAVRLGVARSRLVDLDPAERAKLIKSFKPSGEDFADELVSEKALISAEKAIRAGLEKDGYSHVAHHTTKGREAAARLSDTDATIESKRTALAAIIEEQLRLNGGRTDLVKAMAVETASGYARQINEAETSGKIVDVLRGLDQLYGDNVSLALRDLVKAGMDPALSAIPDIKDRLAGMALVEAAAYENKNGTGSLRKSIGEKAKEVDTTLVATWAEFAKTFPAGIGADLGPYRRATLMLAQNYVRTGVDATTAVESAYDAVIGGRWAVSDTVRIPTDRDVEKVITGLEGAPVFLRAARDKIDLAKVTGSKGQKPEDVRDSYIRSVLANGRWVTAPDESGIARLGSNGVPVMVKAKSGPPIPLVIPWERLESYKPGVSDDEFGDAAS